MQAPAAAVTSLSQVSKAKQQPTWTTPVPAQPVLAPAPACDISSCWHRNAALAAAGTWLGLVLWLLAVLVRAQPGPSGPSSLTPFWPGEDPLGLTPVSALLGSAWQGCSQASLGPAPWYLSDLVRHLAGLLEHSVILSRAQTPEQLSLLAPSSASSAGLRKGSTIPYATHGS